MAVSVVDSPAQVVSLLNQLENLPTHPPSLYFDIEGVNLSRHGSITIIQLFHLPQNEVFLVDICMLQETAFDTANQSGTTFRSILESASVPKVFFDVHNDADALFAHFNILLQNVHDIQLLELATRSWPKDRVVGLRQCIQNDLRLTNNAKKQWKAAKDKGKALFSVKNGETQMGFSIRPIPEDVIDYCAGDVKHLPALWRLYSGKIGKNWLHKVQHETEKRLLMSQDDLYEPQGKHKALSPWPIAPKDGNRSLSKKIGTMKGKGKEQADLEDTPKPRSLSAAETVAAKSVYGRAQDQLSNVFIKGPTLGTVPKVLAERPSLHKNKSMQNSAAASGKAVGTASTELASGATESAWTCATCNRQMLRTQQKDHLAGRAHNAKLKQNSSAAPGPTHQPDTAKTRKNKKAKAGTETQKSGSGTSESKSTKHNRYGAGTNPLGHHPDAHPYSDWGFIGFSQNAATRSVATSTYDDVYFGGGMDYGLCDKDCGWCGHCMDGADV